MPNTRDRTISRTACSGSCRRSCGAAATHSVNPIRSSNARTGNSPASLLNGVADGSTTISFPPPKRKVCRQAPCSDM
jgi:hypothetical protein